MFSSLDFEEESSGAWLLLLQGVVRESSIRATVRIASAPGAVIPEMEYSR